MLAALAAVALLDSRIDALLADPSVRGAVVGVCVLDGQGRELYARDADTRMVPASNEKILSGAFALAALGPDHRVRTRIWKENGRTVVDAPGDPTLTLEALRQVRKGLGLSSPVHVRQAFAPGVPWGWENDDLPNRYAAPIKAFCFERAGFELLAESGRVLPLPSELGVTVARGKSSGELRVRYDLNARRITVTGALPKERTVIETLAQPQPDHAAARALGGELRHLAGPLPTAPPDSVLESRPLSELVQQCLEASDNVMAEHLMLSAAATLGPLGEDAYDTGPARMRAHFVERAGLSESDLRPTDGSGLSRHNLVTPRAIARILLYARTQPWGAAFQRALAEPGEGTLRTRLSGLRFAGKTGSLNSVSALSGYLTRESGEVWSVSVIVNHTVVASRLIKQLEDEIVRSLSEPTPFGTPVAS